MTINNLLFPSEFEYKLILYSVPANQSECLHNGLSNIK